MSSLSEIRTQLLQQHADIRSEIETARRLCAAQPVDHAKLEASVARLVSLVREHNLAEEDALRDVLPMLDAFGEVRKEVMLSDHMTEHQELQFTLVAAASGGDSSQTRANLEAVLARLLAHMDHEENLFLAEKLLV